MRGERFREGGGIVQRLIFALCLPPTDSPLHLLRRFREDVVRAQPGEQGVYDLRSRGRVYDKLWLLHSVAPSLRSRVRVPARGTPLSVNSRPPQATRKGWPYYIRPLHKPHERIVSRRATPCGWPASRSHWLQLTLRGVPLAGTLKRGYGSITSLIASSTLAALGR